MKRRIISAFLVFAMMFVTIGTTGPLLKVEAVDYKTIKSGDVLQEKFTVDSVAAYYKITATDTMYYRFVFENQSVEVRTGISIADNLLNLFLGKMTIQIKDAYDKVLSDFSVRCGYTGGVSLKLQKGETYYIKATSNIDGNYRLAVTSIKDIGGDTWQSATETLSVGQFVSAIDANGDKDWFWFETDSSDSFYKFSLENISGSSSMYLYLYEYVEGAGTTPLRDKFNFSVYRSETGTKEIKLKPNTKYYFCIYQSSGTGGYLFNITQNLDAVPDTVENAYKIDTDVKVTTALDGAYDVDWFKFTTKDYDAYYYFTVENLSVSKNYIHVRVYDSNGNEQKSGYAYVGSCPFTVNVKLLPNTEYYFKIYNGYEYNSSLGEATGNYTVTVTDVADSYPDEMKDAVKIETDTEYTASLSGAYDIDWFKFTTKDYDAYYYFTVDNLSIKKDYIHVRVYDSNGNEQKSGYAYVGSCPFTVNVKLLPNTEYYFKIYNGYEYNSSLGEATGNYTVTVTDVADSYPNEMKDAVKIETDTEYTASLSGAYDIDWFKFTTKDYDAYYNFTVDNLSVNEDYIFIKIYDSNENEQKSGYAYVGRCPFTVNVKLLPNTEYYFKIYSGIEYSNSFGDGIGNYTVTVTVSEDPDRDTKEGATAVEMNSSFTKELSADSDVDWFKVTLDRDCNVRFVGKNESGSEKKINVYSAINQEKIYLSVYSQSEKAMILDAGEYYIKVSGKAGYYTVGIGDCGSGHNIDYRITPPTATAEGIKTEYCTSCKTVLGKTVIPKLLSGDANSDSKVNLSDVSTILKYIAKWSVSIDLGAADVTHDGKVNLADASLLLKYIAKWDVTLG